MQLGVVAEIDVDVYDMFGLFMFLVCLLSHVFWFHSSTETLAQNNSGVFS